MLFEDADESLEEYSGATPGTMTKRLVGPILEDTIRHIGSAIRVGPCTCASQRLPLSRLAQIS